MQILYDVNKDLLYIRLDEQKQTVINRRLSEDIVLDVGEGDRIVGIEILDASKRLNLERLLPWNIKSRLKAWHKKRSTVANTRPADHATRAAFWYVAF